MYNEQNYLEILKDLSDTSRDARVLYFDVRDQEDEAFLQAMEASVHAILIRHGKMYVRLRNHTLVPEDIYAFTDRGDIYAIDAESLQNILTDDEYSALVKRTSDEEAYADFAARSGLTFGSSRLISTTVTWGQKSTADDRPKDDSQQLDYRKPENKEPVAPSAGIENEEKELASKEEPPIEKKKEEAVTVQNETKNPEGRRNSNPNTPEQEAESDDDFLSRIMAMDTTVTVVSEHENMPVTEPEGEDAGNSSSSSDVPQKGHITAPYEDCTEIEKTDLMQYYAAFLLKMNDQVGRYELMAAPLNPKHPTGRFVFWVKKWNSGRAYVTVSESSADQKEEGIYRFINMKNGLYAKLTPEYHDGQFRIRISISDENRASIEIKSEKSLGKAGHIIFTDEESDTAIHAIPVDMHNNENGNAGYFYVVEDPERAHAGQYEDGTGQIKTAVGSYQMTLRWNENRLYAQLI